MDGLLLCINSNTFLAHQAQDLIVSKVTNKPSECILFFFIDINKPLDLTHDNLLDLDRLLSDRMLGFPNKLNAKFIVAVSSNFPLYLKTSPASTGLRAMFNSQPVYTTKAFSCDQANRYLSKVSDAAEKESILKATNYIPRLLSFYHIDKPNALESFTDYVRKNISAEFDDICKYISKANSTVVMLQMEAKLLWAVQAKLPYPLFGITRECVNELWFVKSYIVSINNEVPELYFPLSEGQIQHITMHMSNAYYNNVTKTDNVMTALKIQFPVLFCPILLTL